MIIIYIHIYIYIHMYMLLYVPCIVYYNNLWHVRCRERQWVSGCDSVWSTNRVWSCLERCSALQLASLGVRGRSWHYPYSSIREVIDISAEPLKFQLKSGGIQEPASAIVCVWNYLQVISHVFSQMLFQFKEARTRPLLHTITSSYTIPEQAQEKTTRVVWNIGYFPISWK